MFILKFMGFLDLFTGIAILLFQYSLASHRFMLSFIAYLIIKGLMFKGDAASIVDIFLAAYILFMFIYPVTLISLLAALYLFQKGVLSVFS